MWGRFGLSPKPQSNLIQEPAAPEILSGVGRVEQDGGWGKHKQRESDKVGPRTVFSSVTVFPQQWERGQ